MFMTYKKGFTLIEVLTALFVISVGLVAIFSVVNRVFFSTSLSVSRMTASYIAQEGIEVVRNIRDSNWLADRSGSTWTNNMIIGSYSEIDYNDSALVAYTGRPLELHQSGFYERSKYTQAQWDASPGVISGYSQSIFKRRIIISTVDADTINVKVEVMWSEKGGDHSVIIEEELHNWI
jgi:prepilin-type N-terminal cleavage/methylation domain-containing protein